MNDINNSNNENTQNNPETKTANLNVFVKLHNIQDKIEKLEKSEENKFQKYFFFNEEQLLEKLKPLFKEQKLLILVSDVPNTFESKKENSTYEIKYLKQAIVVDIEELDFDRNSFTFNFYACASNNDLAKAKGSAETYAMKYFLQKFFLIPVVDKLDADRGKEESEWSWKQKQNKK